jgi:hypothetical protein
VRELERVVGAIKRVGAGSVKYAKWSYSPATGAYHLKIYLVKPLEWGALAEIVRELEREFRVAVYAPHANAIRLDLRRK